MSEFLVKPDVAKDGKVRAYEGEEPYIFISYAHKNKAAVSSIIRLLDANDYRLWVDDGSFLAGDKFAPLLYNKVQNSFAVVAFLSDDYFNSNFCKFELLLAHASNQRIHPFFLGDNPVETPGEFTPFVNSSHQVAIKEKDINLLTHALAETSSKADVLKCLQSNEELNRLFEVIESNIPNEAKDKKEVVVEDGIKKIIKGESFSTNVSIALDISVICKKAYEKKVELAKIDFGGGLKKIEDEVFRGCTSLKETIFPATLNHIGNSAFRDCSAMQSIDFKESEIDVFISPRAFESCIKLESASLPKKLTTLDSSVFNSCVSLKTIDLPYGLELIGENTFGECSGLESINIPASVIKIDDLAFAGCSALSGLVLNDGLRKIGNKSFRGCGSLQSISIPSTVVNIGMSAFRGCTSLEYFEVNKDNKNYTVLDGVLFDKSKSGLVAYPANKDAKDKSYEIPDSVTIVHKWAFADEQNLDEIVVPDSVNVIADGAFYNCQKLRILTIPDSVIKIGDYAFKECDSLAVVTIPDSVTQLGWGLFDGCDSNFKVKCVEGSKIFNFCKEKNIETMPLT